jgi:thiamine biosynthesis lipoprotein
MLFCEIGEPEIVMNTRRAAALDSRTGNRATASCRVALMCILATTPATVTRQVATMGTTLQISVEARDRSTALAATESALRAVEAANARLSTWSDGRELGALNHTPPGVWLPLSPKLVRDLEAAGYWWRESEGAFDPGVASLVAVWELRGAGRVPRDGELVEARRSAGFGHLEIEAGRARRLVGGFGVDEGGFGKGVALGDAARAALAAGASCVELDFGGQLLVSGGCEGRIVAIADPFDRTQVIATLPLRSGSVATSGASERFVEVDGQVLGHVLDPRTGRPAAAWGSVTVIADDPVVADCVATALFVMGPESGLAWAERRTDFDAVFAVGAGDDVVLSSTSGVLGLSKLMELHEYNEKPGEGQARGGVSR